MMADGKWMYVSGGDVERLHTEAKQVGKDVGLGAFLFSLANRPGITEEEASEIVRCLWGTWAYRVGIADKLRNPEGE